MAFDDWDLGFEVWDMWYLCLGYGLWILNNDKKNIEFVIERMIWDMKWGETSGTHMAHNSLGFKLYIVIEGFNEGMEPDILQV